MSRLLRYVIIPAALVSLAWPGLAQTRKTIASVSRQLQPAFVFRLASPRDTIAQRSTLGDEAPLYAGDVLQTDVGGRMRVLFKDGSVVSLGSRTRLQLPDNQARPRYQLMYGIARLQLAPDSSFEILTQTALCRGRASGEVLVDARSTVATFVLNLGKSPIELEGERGKATLRPGEGLWTDRGYPSKPRGDELQTMLDAADLKPPPNSRQ